MTNDDGSGAKDGAEKAQGDEATRRAREAAKEALTYAIQRAHHQARSIAPVRGQVKDADVAQLRGLLEAIAGCAPAGLEAAAALAGRQERDDTADVIAAVYSRAAAVAHAAGDAAAFDEWLTIAARHAIDDEVLGELAVAREHPDAYCKLVSGRYLFARGKERAARKQWRELGKRPELRSMRKLIEREEKAPRALKDGELPGLWRINGCGLAFYGRRDRWPDGSYATTHCICLVFVPVIPLSAYRVRDSGEGYQILAREQLSGFARGFRALVLAGAALLVAIAIAKSYLNDPDRLARQRVESAVTEAHQLAKTAPEAALQKLLAIEEADLARADAKRGDELGADVMTLTASFIKRPFSRDKLEQAGRLVERYEGLPPSAKQGARPVLRAALYDFLADVGGAPAESDVRLQLLRYQAELFGGAPPAELADRIAKEVLVTVTAQGERWPLEMLEFVLAQSPLTDELTAQVEKLGARLLAQPQLLRDLSPDAFDRWLATAAPSAKRARATREQGEASRKAVTGEKAETAALEAALKAEPWNQAAAVLLAGEAAGAGKLDEATARLTAIGPPGELTREARLLLGQLLAAAGQLDEADALLTSLVAPRLARFSEALAALGRAETTAIKLAQDALRTSPPYDLRQRYDELAGDEAAQEQLVQRWVGEQVRGDAEVRRHQASYEALADVVPASLELGTLKLRRAQGLPDGAARSAMLLEAERAFLGIRAAAQGQDEFQLGLGEIYARLGKAKESEAELGALLAKDQPQLSLAVATLYRTLGNYERGKAVAVSVYEHAAAGPPEKSKAAVLMSLMEAMTSEERASQWLHKADPNDPFVRVSLLEEAASKLKKEGKRKEAAAAYERVAIAWMEQASARNSAAYNNASLAQQSRYLCNGELDALADAEASLEKAYRISGDNALVVGNLSATLLRNAQLRALAKLINPRALPLDEVSANTLLRALFDGPDAALAQQLRSALAASPAQRRGEQLLATYGVLAPSSTEGYQRAFRSASLWRDEAAAAAVVARARAAKSIDTSNNDRAVEEWLSGASVPTFASFYRGEVEPLLAIADDAKLDARTRAAAYLLTISSSDALGTVLGGDEKDLARAVSAAQQVDKLWPALSVHSLAIEALIDQAALASDAAAWRPLRRLASAETVLTQLHQQGHPLAAAVLASPQWREVVARATADRSRPYLDGLRVARLIGDAALVERSKAVLDDKITRLDYELDLVLSPKSPTTKANLSYLDKR